jgi:N-acetylglucosaminyldiphosphoundecaprenol N-acetyl-beta-D-mannosaminyltransferase
MLQRLLRGQEAASEGRPDRAAFAPRVVACDEPAQGQVTRFDDLSREAYCIIGMPIDALDMRAAVQCVVAAVARRAPYLISTPNLNFLVQSLVDPQFRETLLSSDLCPADGMPIVWLARSMGVRMPRIAGSDIFDALKSSGQRFKIFLFGGQEGVADAACHAINSSNSSLHCAGYYYPGFVSVEDMSQDEIITRINASNADLLVVALGATKGQAWLMRNHRALQIPVRAHLGAIVNFEAGTVTRAPERMRDMGLEWMWRIYQEPYLWRRYWRDGRILLRLLLTRVVPLMIWRRWLKLMQSEESKHFALAEWHHDESSTISLKGFATAEHVKDAISSFRLASYRKIITIHLGDLRFIDSRFLGLLLMLRKTAKERGAELQIVEASKIIRRLFRLYGADYLLN